MAHTVTSGCNNLKIMDDKSCIDLLKILGLKKTFPGRVKEYAKLDCMLLLLNVSSFYFSWQNYLTTYCFGEVKLLGANELVTKTKVVKLDTLKQFSLKINAALRNNG